MYEKQLEFARRIRGRLVQIPNLETRIAQEAGCRVIIWSTLDPYSDEIMAELDKAEALAAIGLQSHPNATYVHNVAWIINEKLAEVQAIKSKYVGKCFISLF